MYRYLRQNPDDNAKLIIEANPFDISSVMSGLEAAEFYIKQSLIQNRGNHTATRILTQKLMDCQANLREFERISDDYVAARQK